MTARRLVSGVAVSAGACLACVFIAFVLVAVLVTATGTSARVGGVAVLLGATCGIAAGTFAGTRRLLSLGAPASTATRAGVAGAIVVEFWWIARALVSGGEVIDGTAAFIVQQLVLAGAAVGGARLGTRTRHS